MTVTLRGVVGQTFNATSDTVTLPAGSAAGDWALLLGAQANSFSSHAGITGWERLIGYSSNGQVHVWRKQLTSADITAGSVTINWSGSSQGFSALAVAQAAYGYMAFTQIRGLNETTTSNTMVVEVKNGESAVYVAHKRKSGSAVSVTLSTGTLGSEPSITGFAGAIRYENVAAEALKTVTATYTTGGENDSLFMWIFSDTGRDGSTVTDATIAAAAAVDNDAWLYKGRATRTEDAAGTS